MRQAFMYILLLIIGLVKLCERKWQSLRERGLVEGREIPTLLLAEIQ